MGLNTVQQVNEATAALIQQEQPLRLLRLPAVLDRIGLKKSALYELIASGKFSQPVKLLGGKCSAWPESEVNDFIRRAIAERDGTNV